MQDSEDAEEVPNRAKLLVDVSNIIVFRGYESSDSPDGVNEDLVNCMAVAIEDSKPFAPKVDHKVSNLAIVGLFEEES